MDGSNCVVPSFDFSSFPPMIHSLEGELEQFLIKTDISGQIYEMLCRNTSRFNESNAFLASASNTASLFSSLYIELSE